MGGIFFGWSLVALLEEERSLFFRSHGEKNKIKKIAKRLKEVV